MIKSSILGFPRIGSDRELKKSIESYWKGKISTNDLLANCKNIREKNWILQKGYKIDYVPSNDFSMYDQTLDMSMLLGCIPDRFKQVEDKLNNIDLYFAMARGLQKDEIDITALEMTKWFDTNYHYLVPEFSRGQKFKLSSSKIFDEYKEAKAIGIETRPVIIGPVTYLLLGKAIDGSNKLDLVDNLLEVYEEIFKKLSELGVKDLQIDEPFLVTDLTKEQKDLYLKSYQFINKIKRDINIHLATYFDSVEDNLDVVKSIDCYSFHIDIVRSPDQLKKVIEAIGRNRKISLGLVDGRNIWINDIENSISIIKSLKDLIDFDNLIISSSSSLLHTPVDLNTEKLLDKEIKSWLAFATQKLEEIYIISELLNGNNKEEIIDFYEKNKALISAKKTSVKIHDSSVKNRASSITEKMLERSKSYKDRREVQKEKLNLPILPTTTIGSFPQTKEVRAIRANFKKGNISLAEYNKFLQEETLKVIKFQEEIGLDVLVHGEFERNDMVEYFGEQLKGFCFTENGWVQSYGTRCVKPPIIYGDVSRPKPMTIDWSSYAQSKTSKIMKGMLTGPITILQWSFVRNDQSRKDTAFQISLAIRDEVKDLESAGIKIIQIDEAALREGLPIKKKDWKNYLDWAVKAFKISSSVAKDETQIHTHMCYSEFNDIIESIAKMDADVISIETSRSQMELLKSFIDFKYPNDIGPGVYDIHSPRVPSFEEMKSLLDKALEVLKPEQIWVNPDCGLKTRDWPETKSALSKMVESAKEIRKTIH